MEVEIIPGSNARRRTDKLSLQFESNQRIVCRSRSYVVAEGKSRILFMCRRHVAPWSMRRQYNFFFIFLFLSLFLISSSPYSDIVRTVPRSGLLRHDGSLLAPIFCYNEGGKIFHAAARGLRLCGRNVPSVVMSFGFVDELLLVKRILVDRVISSK